MISRVIQEQISFHTRETGQPNIGMEDMSKMFNGATNFNQDINRKKVTIDGIIYTAWDTSRVTNMGHMFAGAQDFNQNIVHLMVLYVSGIKFCTCI